LTRSLGLILLLLATLLLVAYLAFQWL
jgi:hypothetical protein